MPCTTTSWRCRRNCRLASSSSSQINSEREELSHDYRGGNRKRGAAMRRVATMSTVFGLVFKIGSGGFATTQPVRALWKHAPYFHDGSAPDLLSVVNHNDRLFG